MGRRIPAAALLLSLGLALAGCTIAEPSDAARAASFQALAQRQVEGEPLWRFLRQRTVDVISGVELHEVHATETGYYWRGQPTGEAHQFGLSAAVPIAEDGYFLTTAHSVPWEPSYVVIRKGEQVRWAPARVVWRGEAARDGFSILRRPQWSGETDLAILYAPLAPPAVVEQWADAEALTAGERLAGAGSSGVFAGHLLELGIGVVELDEPTDADGGGVMWLRHDLPTRGGDSGGPVVLTDGRFAGIHSKGIWTLNLLSPGEMYRHTGVTVLPERDWVMQVIEADRQRRAAGDF